MSPRPYFSMPLDRRHLLTAGTTALALGALAPPASATQPVATPGATPGLDSDGHLRRIVEDTMATMMVPGAVVLARTPQGEFAAAFGTRILGQDVPVTLDDHFRIGSNTKTMTGTVLLQLVEEGEIALEQPVMTYRPDVPNGDNIAISRLLDMTSGLFNYSELRSFNEILDREPDRAWDPEELVAIGLAEPPYFVPGEGFHYSNTNTILAGLIIEQVTGQPLATVFEERLFRPLGLTNTAFPPIDDGTLPDPHPHGYLYGTNASTYDTTVLPDAERDAAYAGELQPNDVTSLNPSWGWAAGAASATARDLAAFAEALVDGTLVAPDLQQRRLDSLHPIGDAPDAARYGLALAQLGPLIGHDGSLPGYQSLMGHDPDAGITLIVMTNLQSAPDGRMPANEIARSLIAAIYAA
jgi:D-alanyl-D-alanine carboxypeptidase